MAGPQNIIFIRIEQRVDLEQHVSQGHIDANVRAENNTGLPMRKIQTKTRYNTFA